MSTGWAQTDFSQVSCEIPNDLQLPENQEMRVDLYEHLLQISC